MKSKVLLAVVLSLFAFAAVAQQRKPRAANPKKAAPATVAIVSEINMARLKGLLTETKQRPLLVNFWATWCDPCRDEFPDLVKIDGEYRPNRMDFVTVYISPIATAAG